MAFQLKSGCTPCSCPTCGGKSFLKVADRVVQVIVPASVEIVRHIERRMVCKDCDTTVSGEMPSTGKPGFFDGSRLSGQDQVLMGFEPFALCQGEKLSAVKAASSRTCFAPIQFLQTGTSPGRSIVETLIRV